MRRILLIPLAVLLIGGTGIAAWKFGLPYYEERELAAERERSEPRFTTLDPFVVPVIERGVVTRQVTLVLSLEVAGVEARDRVERLRADLRDSLFTELYGLLGRRFMAERPDQLSILASRLKVAAERTLGPEAVLAVSIRNIHHKHLASTS